MPSPYMQEEGSPYEDDKLDEILQRMAPAPLVGPSPVASSPWEMQSRSQLPWPQRQDIQSPPPDLTRLNELQQRRSDVAGRPFEFRDFLGSLLFGGDYLNLANHRRSQNLGVLGDQEDMERQNLQAARADSLRRKMASDQDFSQQHLARQKHEYDLELQQARPRAAAQLSPEEKVKLAEAVAAARKRGNMAGLIQNLKASGLSDAMIAEAIQNSAMGVNPMNRQFMGMVDQPDLEGTLKKLEEERRALQE